ncbi:Twin-arginine translocation pathway signal [Streptomyces sp. URMC 126]|uniref:Twin-arginine translocation pathway signal n=1 Tax=Streptomyces sp. URMC 126 TaxID=3423401 RepID=UPI003F1E17BE
MVGYFREQLEGHYRADMLLGPHDLIGIVSSQYALIDRLSRAATDGTRRELLRTGAAYAALIGWLCQDAGDLVSSASWRAVAQEASFKARDPLLVAYSLVNQAQLRTDVGDGSCVIDLCEAALATGPELPPKVRVMALQQQAHGYSLEGDRRSCDRVLDRADALVSRVDDDLPWGNACRRTPVYLEVQRATCYGRLGLGKEAGRLWSQVLQHVPTTARRDRGVYSARFARAALTTGDRDLARELARAAVPVAVDTGSVRLRRELMSLRTVANRAGRGGAGIWFDDVLAPLTGRDTT